LNMELNRLPAAEELFRQAVAIDQKTRSPLLCDRTQNLGVALMQEKKYPEAEEFFREAISLKLLKFEENHWNVATTRNLLGACLYEQKKFREAEPLLLQSYGIIKATFGIKHDRTRRAASRLINLYNATGRKDKAAAITVELEPGK